jgi:hypothetical protein
MSGVSKTHDLGVIPSRPRGSYAILGAADLAKPTSEAEVGSRRVERGRGHLDTLPTIHTSSDREFQPPPNFNIDRDNLSAGR